MSKQPFGKFIQQKEKGSQKKERIRQEKKAVRKETKAYFDQKKAEKRAEREQYRNSQPPAGGYRPSEGGNRSESGGERQGGYRGGKKVNKGYNRMSYMERKKKQAERDANPDREPPVVNKKAGKPASRLTNKQEQPAPGNKREQPAVGSPKASTGAKKTVTGTGYKKPVGESRKPVTGNKPAATTNRVAVTKNTQQSHTGKQPVTLHKQQGADSTPSESKSHKPGSLIPLNKFLSHSGVSSRRDAAEIVKSGTVVVNGKVITEPGFKVSEKDEVKVNGKQIAVRRTMVYILINKPKDFITTTEDPQGRRTVLDLIRNATTERVYPVGRLDRNTTGVLLLTNDGDLAQKLAHPSYQVKKIYEVKLDKPLTKKDFDAILQGIELEDGFIAPDVLAYADPKDKSVIGIEIHSGRNRIVRRIFEHLGYDVRNLDRVMYANLTKKNVDRGKWRFLNEKEVRLLKYLNASFTKSKKPARG